MADNPPPTPPGETLSEPQTPHLSPIGTMTVDFRSPCNFKLISPTKLVYFSGISWFILDLQTNQLSENFSRDGGGIGALAVDPSMGFLAIGEKSENPGIFIYSLPGIEDFIRLSGGAERGFSALSFSASGERLASIGTAPDYWLAVWDWRAGTILLRSKAFSQEIYGVRFSDFSEDSLVSFGTAHVKFWRIAETFTGRKLKGEIGKFGRVELSDISCAVILKGNNVLSGSEGGWLLLWEGNQIKARLTSKEGEPCHSGELKALALIREFVLTAGADGYLRVWSIESVEKAESAETGDVEMEMIGELAVGAGVVRMIVEGFDRGELLVVCGDGTMKKVKVDPIKGELLGAGKSEDGEMNHQEADTPHTGLLEKGGSGSGELFRFGPGRVVAVLNSVTGPLLAASDGTLVRGAGTSQSISLRAACRALTCGCQGEDWLAVGDEAGVVRLLDGEGGVKDLVRALAEPVVFLAGERRTLVAAGRSQVFCLAIEKGKLRGQGLFTVKGGIEGLKLRWGKVYVATSTGEVAVYKAGSRKGEGDYSLSAEELEERRYPLRMSLLQKPRTDKQDLQAMLADDSEAVEVEWTPGPLTAFELLGDDRSEKALVAAGGDFVGWIYLLGLGKGETAAGNGTGNAALRADPSSNGEDLPRPERIYPTRPVPVGWLSVRAGADFALIGYFDGIVSLRNPRHFEQEIAIVRLHSPDTGRVSWAATLNDRLVSLASDGSVASAWLEPLKTSTSQALNASTSQPLNITTQLGQLPGFSPEVDSRVAGGYSLQEEKIQLVADSARRAASDFRASRSSQLASLRRRFAELRLEFPGRRVEFAASVRLDLQHRAAESAAEARREREYSLQVASIRRDRLRRFFLSELSGFYGGVSRSDGTDPVVALRIRELTDFMRDKLEILAEKIEGGEAGSGCVGEESSSARSKDIRGLLEELKEIRNRKNVFRPEEYIQQRRVSVKEECKLCSSVEELRVLDLKIEKELLLLRAGRSKETPLSELEEAGNSLGQYQLKEAESFEPDEENRINVKNAQMKLVLIEKLVFSAAKVFNGAVEKLHKEKMELAELVHKTNIELEAIDKELGQKHNPLVVVFDHSVENPLRVFNVTNEEIREHLQENEPLNPSTAQPLNPSTSDKTANQPLNPSTVNPSPLNASTPQPPNASSSHRLLAFPVFPLEERSRKITHPDTSYLTDSASLRASGLRSRATRLRTQVETWRSRFDSSVSRLREERFKLEFELKLAQMRALEYFRELLEVEVFEEEDEQLLIELASRRKTLRDFNEKKAMNSVDLEEKAVKEADCGADLESASSNCRELVFPGEPQRCEFIFSYARYHYRRNGAGDGGVAESEEAEFSQLTGEKKEWVQIYDQNEDWKEAVQKRFVAEENLTRAREDRAQALLEKSRLDEKVFAAESALRQARESLNSFQKRKLDRVNSLPHSFLLTANQVLVPLDQINSALLFASPVLEKLDKRALELEDERLQITREHEELLSAGGALNKEINLLRAANKLAQAELSENFRLKFGHPIELKLLDGLKSSRKLKELKTELHELQKAGEKKVEEAQNSLRKTKDELIAQKKKSTEVLKQIAELSSEELRLNKTLDSNNRQVLKEDNDSQKQDLMRKRTELVSVVKLLTGELEELKAEIVTLKSKSVGMV